MDAGRLAELEAAIVAHFKRLEALGVTMPAAHPGELGAVDILPLLLAHPSGTTGALITNLRAICALGMRAKIAERRKAVRVEGEKTAANAKPGKRRAAAARAKRTALVMDDSHFQKLEPPLRQVADRARTARRALYKFQGAELARHRKLVSKGIVAKSAGNVDLGLCSWLAMQLAMLEDDIVFVLAELQGPVALPGVGHEGPADGVAWNQVLGDCLLRLKEAGVEAADRMLLFPRTFRRARDRDEARMRRELEYKSAMRAKRRRKSSG